MAIIEVKALTKDFGKVKALNGINFTLDQGEVLAYLGPNGSGKTTTIRVLLGILRATSGSAKIFGQDAWTNAVELHQKIAFVPGDVNLWPNLTGGEVIDLFTSFQGGHRPSLERRNHFIKLFDLDPTKKCRTYSKGNRQKVALVAALASNAELFILDEPTSGLDPLVVKTFEDCILKLKSEGKSILLSSHILSEVEKLADSVVIIREGQVVKSGTMKQIHKEAHGRTLEELFLSEYQTKRGRHEG